MNLFAATLAAAGLGAALITVPYAGAAVPVATNAETAQKPAHEVDVYVGKRRITFAEPRLRPGNTVFHVHFSPTRGHAAVQLLRLRNGYTFHEFSDDIESDDLSALDRIDRRVIFYGGLPVTAGTSGKFALRLERGTYWLIDFDSTRRISFRVTGEQRHGSLPAASGEVDMVMQEGGHRFDTPTNLPSSGWMSQTNHTDEPHFMDMFQVKPSTTSQQVRRALNGTGGSQWLIKENPGSFVVSPGRTMVWQYSYPPGRYLELCFWTSAEHGMTHAEMGMWAFVTLDPVP